MPMKDLPLVLFKFALKYSFPSISCGFEKLYLYNLNHTYSVFFKKYLMKFILVITNEDPSDNSLGFHMYNSWYINMKAKQLAWNILFILVSSVNMCLIICCVLSILSFEDHTYFFNNKLFSNLPLTIQISVPNSAQMRDTWTILLQTASLAGYFLFESCPHLPSHGRYVRASAIII